MNGEIFRKKNAARLAVLVDPDKCTGAHTRTLLEISLSCRVDYFFVGGSLITGNTFDDTVTQLKQQKEAPVILFPGSHYQLSAQADALLMLSLVSGRNAEYLIGQHVTAAPRIRQMKLPVIPTGYILIDGGNTPATAYITQTLPIPRDKPDIAAATALAAEMLGMQVIYLEAGSGARATVSAEMIQAVKEQVQLPVIVGGGIRTPEDAERISAAGADVIVVGNVLEKNPETLLEISLAVHQSN
ncbi:MAG: geranylgeranylglyceryl/heptaprenylglyceryl phosphate synthase [Chitinophagales bacterium]|nr:geranylgeranylglyceryl/heptaprenylglyceryl phosphate synthase [Chitinophagales bacterium]MDW8418631.1 geranylgeranylglyceryl/heptaprenylglyceryl phosphate synthase [Chitinophagales bacterium]